MTPSKFAAQIVLAYGVSVPLGYLATGDQPAAESAIQDAIAADATARGIACPPIWHLDSTWGLEPLNDAARASISDFCGEKDPSMLCEPLDACKAMRPWIDPETERRYGIPPRSVLIWWDADDVWTKPGVALSLLRLRDWLCAAGSEAMVIGLGNDPGRIPALIQGDVLLVRDPLPSDTERAAVVRDLCAENSIPADARTIAAASGATASLTGFQVGQASSLGCATGRLDLDVVGSRTREMLGALPGITIDAPEDPRHFAGVPYVLDWARDLVQRIPIRLVVLLDEAEKIVQSGGDARDGGATAGIFKALLTHLAYPDPRVLRNITILSSGLPGVGKSTLARVVASLAQCPIVMLDTDSLKNEYVGASKRNAEQAFGRLLAFGGVHLWMATCNRTHDDQGQPLFREEFTSRMVETFYFGVPDLAQLDAIWLAQLRKFGLPPSERPPQALYLGWTGRDIVQCLQKSLDYGITVHQAAERHVASLRKVGREVGERNRIAAENSYTDASTGRPYMAPSAASLVAPAPAGRKLRTAAPAAPVAPPPAPSPSDTEDF
jgi:hypothetical protein